MISLLLFTSLLAAQTRDYTQWRGEYRDGSASDFTEPKTWPEQLHRRWKVEIGEGYATPLISGNRVYMFTRRDNREALTALDAATGKTLYTTGYEAPHEVAPAAKTHGPGPKATPLLQHGKLFTLGLSGIVTSFDAANGKILWQKPAPPEHPYFGTASSPIGYKNLVLVHPGNYGPLTAYDEITGYVKWTADGGGLYASPLIAEMQGATQVISVTQQGLAAFSLNDGTLLWRHDAKLGDVYAISPIVHDGLVLFSGNNAGITAFRPVLKDGKWTAGLAWSHKDVSMLMSNPVIIDGRMYGLSQRNSGQYFSLQARSGEVLWLGSPKVAANAALVKAGSLLFTLDNTGTLTVARALKPEPEILRTYKVADSPTWAQPTISGDRIFVKDVNSITLWTLVP